MIAVNSPALAETLQTGQENKFARTLTVVKPTDATKPSQNIPEELKALAQWVAWKAVPDFDKDMNQKEKPRKVPINVSTWFGARPNVSSTLTLCNWRHNRKGPDYIKFSRKPIYLKEDLDRFIEAHRIKLTS